MYMNKIEDECGPHYPMPLSILLLLSQQFPQLRAYKKNHKKLNKTYCTGIWVPGLVDQDHQRYPLKVGQILALGRQVRLLASPKPCVIWEPILLFHRRTLFETLRILASFLSYSVACSIASTTRSPLRPSHPRPMRTWKLYLLPQEQPW